MSESVVSLVFTRLIVLALLSLTLSACHQPITTDEFEFLICERGSIVVRETLNSNTGARGGVFANYLFIYRPKGSAVSIDLEVNGAGSYRNPEEKDGFTVFEKPYEAKIDERLAYLFVDPVRVSDEDYRALVGCLQQGMEKAYDRLRSKGIRVCAPGKQCNGFLDRQVARFVNVRHRGLASLRREFQCPGDLMMYVSEFGHTFFSKSAKTVSSMGWHGYVVDEGTRLIFESSNAARPLNAGASLNMEFLAKCIDAKSRPIGGLFNLDILPQEQYGSLVSAARKRALGIDQQANRAPNANARHELVARRLALR